MGWLRRLRRGGEPPAEQPDQVLAPAKPAGGVGSTGDWQAALLLHFDILSVLGSGGYSTVFHARRRADGQLYALKVTDLSRLTDWSRQAAVREARVLAALAGSSARLPHPCLATFREAFCLGTRLCIVTDPAPGGDLKQLLEQRAAAGSYLKESEVWGIFLQVALALQHLHAHWVLHRDVKPANCLMGADGLVQLTDLGVCGQLSAVFTRKEAGTPQYKAPEMWNGHPYSFSSDLWALGCLLWEMCTGRPLFVAPPSCKTEEAAVASVRQQVLAFERPRRLPPRYSAELDMVVQELLRPSPADRPSTAELLAWPAVVARVAQLPPRVQEQLAEAAAAAEEQQLQQHGPPPAGSSACSACSPTKLRTFEPPAVNAALPPAAYPGDSAGLLGKPALQHLPQKQGRSVWPTPRRGRQSERSVLAPTSRDCSAASRGSTDSTPSVVFSIDSLDLAAAMSRRARSRSASTEGLRARLVRSSCTAMLLTDGAGV